MATVPLRIEWSNPMAFRCVRTFPSACGVYCVLLSSSDKHEMVRIGATRNLNKRPANYHQAPFLIEPRLLISYCEIPAPFRADMQSMLSDAYPQYLKDCGKLEYRMERLLLDEYTRRTGRLPPGNFSPGSDRVYLPSIRLFEVGALRVLEMPPAELGEELRKSLVQGRRASRLTPGDQALPEHPVNIRMAPSAQVSDRLATQPRSRKEFLDALETESSERCDAHARLLDILLRAEGLEPRFDSEGAVHLMYKIYLSGTSQHVARVYANGRVQICLYAFDEGHVKRPDLQEQLRASLESNGFSNETNHSPSLSVPVEDIHLEHFVSSLQHVVERNKDDLA